MRVACLSYFRPDRENLNGPNALLQQLIVHRPTDVQLTLYLAEPKALLRETSIDCIDNKVEIVRLSPREGKGGKGAKAFWPLGARQLSRFDWPDLSGYDLIWVYPFWFTPLMRNVRRPVLITGMDCATLLYARRLKAVRSFRKFGKVFLGLLASFLFDLVYLRGKSVHLVGRADAKLLRRFGCNAHFVPHPLLDYPARALEGGLDGRPLTLLISNADNAVYGSKLAFYWLNAIECFAAGSSRSVHVILHKPSRAFGELAYNKSTSQPALTVSVVNWIEDYPSFLSKISIQLFPLEVGAGTKTSVLTALQHGVYCIASPVAAENIERNHLLQVVKNGDDVAAHLGRVAGLLSGQSRAAILPAHDPARVGAAFWNLAKSL